MVEVRACRREDFPHVLRLLKQLWPDARLDEAKLRAVYDLALASDHHRYLCAVDGQRVVGFGSLSLKNSLWQQGCFAHIDELIVEESSRGHGIGTLLLDRLASEAAGMGCSAVELDSAYHRKEAHAFYRKRGFADRAYLFSKAL
jgi:glucosamine-phosphate N-acetyltransferase